MFVNPEESFPFHVKITLNLLVYLLKYTYKRSMILTLWSDNNIAQTSLASQSRYTQKQDTYVLFQSENIIVFFSII